MRKKFVLAIYYTNINLQSAGIELYIKKQINMFNINDTDVLVVFPVRKKIGLVTLDFWGVMINDQLLQIYSTEQFIYELSRMYENDYQLLGVYIHHLMNVNISDLKNILDVLNNCPIFIYIHDFYTSCIQYNLLKNDLEYCGNARLEHNKCFDCHYYKDSVKMRERFYIFFDAIIEQFDQVWFVSPSSYVANLWSDAYPKYKNKIIIIEHLNAFGLYKKNNHVISDDELLKIAYVGATVSSKGWNQWKNTNQLLMSEKKDYELFQFGNGKPATKNIKQISVSVQKDGPNAMIDAIRNHQIHVAVLNSICPETYSYTYYECMAANAFIITNKNSGNIAAQIKKNKNGIVMKSANDLFKVLMDEESLRYKVNSFRKSSKAPLLYKDNIKSYEMIKNENKIWLKKNKEYLFKKTPFKLLSIVLYNLRYRKKNQVIQIGQIHIVE